MTAPVGRHEFLEPLHGSLSDMCDALVSVSQERDCGRRHGSQQTATKCSKLCRGQHKNSLLEKMVLHASNSSTRFIAFLPQRISSFVLVLAAQLLVRLTQTESFGALWLISQDLISDCVDLWSRFRTLFCEAPEARVVECLSSLLALKPGELGLMHCP